MRENQIRKKHENIKPEKEKEVDEVEFYDGEIVLIMRKTIYWPAQIMQQQPSSVTVKIFRTVVTKKRFDLKRFTENSDICQGMTI